MYLNEFFDSLVGKFLDVDGTGSATNKNQCVDVVKSYCNKVFGVPVSSMSGYGDAWEYFENFSKKTAITPYFNKIDYKSGMQLRAGDIVVWERSVNSSNAGHIAIANGTYNSTSFETFDQNWPSGSACKFVTHNYNKVNGILRPKDYSKVVKSSSSNVSGSGKYPTAVAWKNGTTKEAVFKENNLSGEIGWLAAQESAKCYAKSGNSYLLVYDLDGTNKHKAGFVEYAGGVKTAPSDCKVYKNGSTTETVYADTAKKTVVGSLDRNESCYCLGKTDGMYLVMYNVNGKNTRKCGFVSYDGGL